MLTNEKHCLFYLSLSLVIVILQHNDHTNQSPTQQINHHHNQKQQQQQQQKSTTGSLFELSGGNPKLGLPITAVITALGLPLSVFLIYAAILKGAAETEEADREFTRVKRRL